jgi:hypothetical protein
MSADQEVTKMASGLDPIWHGSGELLGQAVWPSASAAVALALAVAATGIPVAAHEGGGTHPKPLNLFSLVWVADLAHGGDPREAQLGWVYFKHWRRNADGSLSYFRRRRP